MKQNTKKNIGPLRIQCSIIFKAKTGHEILQLSLKEIRGYQGQMHYIGVGLGSLSGCGPTTIGVGTAAEMENLCLPAKLPR